MKFKKTDIRQPNTILANDHYVAINYDCSKIAADDNGIIKAGTIIDGVGVLLNDVYVNENPNGAVVIHGFIDRDKLPKAPTDESAFLQLTFLPIKASTTSDDSVEDSGTDANE